MIGSIIALNIAGFNATVNFFTRLVLILLTAWVYHGFVIAEVFLNSYKLVYPPYLAKPISKFLSAFGYVVGSLLRIFAIQVIFCFPFPKLLSFSSGTRLF